MLEELKLSQLKKISVKSDSVMKKIESLNEAFDQSLEILINNRDRNARGN